VNIGWLVSPTNISLLKVGYLLMKLAECLMIVKLSEKL